MTIVVPEGVAEVAAESASPKSCQSEAKLDSLSHAEIEDEDTMARLTDECKACDYSLGTRWVRSWLSSAHETFVHNFCDDAARRQLLERQDPASAALCAELLAPHEIQQWDSTSWCKVRSLGAAGGCYGAIELVHCHDEEKSCKVIKKLPMSRVGKSSCAFTRCNRTAKERPWVEMGVLRYLNKCGFKHTCRLEGIFSDDAHIYIATSFAQHGDLFNWPGPYGPPPGPAREAQLKPLVAELCDALRQLHDFGIAHRDISLENILLEPVPGTAVDGDGLRPSEQPRLRVLLADFGASTACRHSCGTYGKDSYQAPEMHRRGGVYDAFVSDCFQLGVVLYKLAAGESPWERTDGTCAHFENFKECTGGIQQFIETRLSRAAGLSTRQKLGETLSQHLQGLLTSLLCVEPAGRVTLGEACFNSQRSSVWTQKWICTESI